MRSSNEQNYFGGRLTLFFISAITAFFTALIIWYFLGLIILIPFKAVVIFTIVMATLGFITNNNLVAILLDKLFMGFLKLFRIIWPLSWY